MLFGLLAVPVTASAAYQPLSGVCGVSGASASDTCKSTGTDVAKRGPAAVIEKVTTVLAVIAGVAAVIVIIVSGLQFVLANGDASKAASARSTLIGAAVGLVIIAAAQSIIIFILSKVG
jgi:hypothetical protein